MELIIDNEESFITDFFKNDLHNTFNFLDIGANDGFSFSNTYKLSALGWSGVCLEPTQEAFLKLKRLHGENGKIECINAGVSDVTQVVTFYQSHDWYQTNAPVGILSSMDPNHKKNFIDMNWSEIKCIVYTFEELERLYNLENKKYDFINIDVEGHDLIVLKQLNKKLRYCRLICIEKSLDDQQNQNIIKELNTNNFELIAMSVDNFIAVNKKFS
jgi:FkbM family methyltransferase